VVSITTALAIIITHLGDSDVHVDKCPETCALGVCKKGIGERSALWLALELKLALEAKFVQGVAPSSKRSETYIDVTIKSRHAQALLDTCCESTVCPLRLCRNAKLTPVNTELFAANNTPISVLSTIFLIFEVKSMTLFADVFVSEFIDELILGFEWLNGNNCKWLFGPGRAVFNGVSVQLHTCTPVFAVRRIFVRETVCIPPDCSANVPVQMPFVNMHTPRSDWITQSSEVRPGLLAARTLLADNDQYAAIRFMNVSGVQQSLREGHSLGVASPCDPTLIGSCNADVVNPTTHTGGDNEVATSGAVGNTSGPTHAATGGSDSDTSTEGVRVCSVDDNGPRPGADVDFAHVQPVIDKR